MLTIEKILEIINSDNPENKIFVSRPPVKVFNPGNPPVEKYISKPVKPWMGKKKLSSKQRKYYQKLTKMGKHSSVSLKGIAYNVMQLDEPKNGCQGVCDYYYHCQGSCALKNIVGSQFRFYTLKLK